MCRSEAAVRLDEALRTIPIRLIHGDNTELCGEKPQYSYTTSTSTAQSGATQTIIVEGGFGKIGCTLYLLPARDTYVQAPNVRCTSSM